MSKREEFGLIDIFADAIRLDRSGGEPLYRQLARELRCALRRGEIAGGSRLPSERDLARDLNVSRTTVVAAYRLLRDDGALAGDRGGGTRVIASGRRGAPVATSSMATSKWVEAPGSGVVDLSTSVISGELGLDPRLPSVSPAELGTHYEPAGLPRLREQLAAHYSESGLRTEPSEILVTSGAQQAIALTFSVFARSGGPVLVEAPTYAGALDAARFAGLEVRAARVGQRGVDVEAFRTAVAAHKPSVAYVMSEVQNPTGTTLDPTRRSELLRAAADHDIPVIDDTSLADLAFGRRSRGRGSPAADVIIGSLNKIYSPGLRIGWVRARSDVITKLERSKAVADLGSSEASQLMATALLPRLDEISAKRRHHLAERLALTEEFLSARLPQWSWIRPDGGPFLWVRLPDTDTTAFAELALEGGVRVLPGTLTSTDRSFSDHVRLSCGTAASDLLTGLDRLATAWTRITTHTPARISSPSV